MDLVNRLGVVEPGRARQRSKRTGKLVEENALPGNVLRPMAVPGDPGVEFIAVQVEDIANP